MDEHLHAAIFYRKLAESLNAALLIEQKRNPILPASLLGKTSRPTFIIQIKLVSIQETKTMFLLHSRILEETKQNKTKKIVRLAACLLWGLQCFIQGQRVILPQENKTALFSHAACAAVFSHPDGGAAHGEEEIKETLLSEAGGQVTQTHSPFQPGGRHRSPCGRALCTGFF